MIKKLNYLAHAVAALGLFTQTQAAETILFSDNFEDPNSSSRWSIFSGSATNTIQDFTVDFHFDYSNVTYTLNGQPLKIPPAPSGQGTRGVKLTVNNNDEIPETAAVNIYAKDQTFTGEYALRFDMWINYNGGAFGGTGSTEFAIFGINHAGNQVNWAVPATGVPLPASDGVWFGVTGEAGAAGDYRTYEGDPGGNPLRLTGSLGGFLDRDDNGVLEEDVPLTGDGYPMNLVFRTPPTETRGVPGKRWVQVEVRQKNGLITWVMNGYVIAELPNSGWWTAGTIMLGTMDIFNSIANPREDNFVIFDNVRVVDLSTTPEPARLILTTPILELSEPSGTATVTIQRSGDLSQPLTVWLNYYGTATFGLDYSGPIQTNFPAGQSSLDIPIRAIDDFIGEQDETIGISILHNTAQYEVFAPMTVVLTLRDDGDTSAVGVIPVRTVGYEGIGGQVASFSVYRIGDTSTDLAVNFTLGGQATRGTDYTTLSSPLIIPAGSTNALVVITPLADNTPNEQPETVELTLTTGTGYTVTSSNRATVTIREAGPLLFSDNFNSNSGSNYDIRFEAANNILDYRANFSFDPVDAGLEQSKGGTGGGALLLTVNKDDPTANGVATVNVYPKNANFSGDYLVKFNMFLNYSTAVAGTTESAIFGINHSGNLTNRHAKAGSDGVWFAVETDGSAQGGRSYVLYRPENTTSVPPLDARPASQFTTVFPAPPFKAAGAASGQWVDVVVSQENNVITWTINGTEIFRWTNTNSFTSGKIMLGHMDSFASIGSTNNFTLFDNLEVWSLGAAPEPPVTIEIQNIQVTGGQVVIRFTTTGPTNTLSVLGSENVASGYTVEPNATFRTISTTQGVTLMEATLPVTTPSRFFQIRHQRP